MDCLCFLAARGLPLPLSRVCAPQQSGRQTAPMKGDSREEPTQSSAGTRTDQRKVLGPPFLSSVTLWWLFLGHLRPSVGAAQHSRQADSSFSDISLGTLSPRTFVQTISVSLLSLSLLCIWFSFTQAHTHTYTIAPCPASLESPRLFPSLVVAVSFSPQPSPVVIVTH